MKPSAKSTASDPGVSLHAFALERKARWLSNILGVVACGASLLGWIILGAAYIQAHTTPDVPGRDGISGNLQHLVGGFYLFAAMQVGAAFAFLLALIPSRDRRRTLLFGVPLGAVGFGAACLYFGPRVWA
jgi:hypothetical protein